MNRETNRSQGIIFIIFGYDLMIASFLMTKIFPVYPIGLESMIAIAGFASIAFGGSRISNRLGVSLAWLLLAFLALAITNLASIHYYPS